MVFVFRCTIGVGKGNMEDKPMAVNYDPREHNSFSSFVLKYSTQGLAIDWSKKLVKTNSGWQFQVTKQPVK